MNRIELPKGDINKVKPHKGLIDFNSYDGADASTMSEYVLNKLYNDAMFIEFTDSNSAGTEIMRDGIWIPLNQNPRAWRCGRVVLVGSECVNTKVGDYVMFPNNMGLAIKEIEVAGYGVVKLGIFLNEERLFGGVSPKQAADQNECSESSIRESAGE